MKKAICHRGFALIAVLVAVMLIGLAVVALMTVSMSSTQINSAGIELSTAEFLIEQIREQIDLLAVVDPNTDTAYFGAEEAGVANYDDVDDFDGANFCPPISSEKEVLSDLLAYSQQVTVENVSESNLEQVVSNHSSPHVRVTVNVLLNGSEISSNSWIRTNY